MIKARTGILILGVFLLHCGNSKVNDTEYWADSRDTRVFANIYGFCDTDGYFNGNRVVWYKRRISGDQVVMSNEQIQYGVRHGHVRETVGGYTYLSEYREGKRHGEFKLFGKSGQLIARAHFKEGKLNGKYSNWNEDGTLIKRGEFVDGFLHGTLETWRSNGKLSKLETFEKGSKIGIQWGWDANGRVISRAQVGRNNTHIRQWLYRDSEVLTSEQEVVEDCENVIIQGHSPNILRRITCHNFSSPETIDHFTFLQPPCWQNENECKCSRQWGHAREMYRIVD